FDEATVYIFQMINYVFLFLSITTLFAIIFKILPDARINWRDSFVGAAFTAALFIIGKYLIGLYITNSNVGVTFGAAASIVLILLWVYYSSIILYFGAEFTKVYALTSGSGIEPDKTDVFIVIQEVTEHDFDKLKKSAMNKSILVDKNFLEIRSDYKSSWRQESKVAIITGGDSGIGRAISVHFALEGAD